MSETTEAPMMGSDSMDPNSDITLQVYSSENAGRTPKTRFGVIEFDDSGFGEVSCKVRDVELLEQLKWLLPEDRKRFGLLAPVVESRPAAAPSGEAKRLAADAEKLREELLAAGKAVAEAEARAEAAEAAAADMKTTIDAQQAEIDKLKTAVAATKKKTSKK